MKRVLFQWLLMAFLAAVVVFVTAIVNRDVYSKEETDTKIETVREFHKIDYDHMKEQVDLIQEQTQKLVDHLIEEE